MIPPNSRDTDVTKTITRKQLRGLGASQYHAVKVTKDLEPVRRQGHAYLFTISEVIHSIRSYRERPRLKPETHTKLKKVLDTLLDVLGNVVTAPFSNTASSPASQLSQRLMQAMAKTDASLASLKLDAAKIQSEHALSGE